VRLIPAGTALLIWRTELGELKNTTFWVRVAKIKKKQE